MRKFAQEILSCMAVALFVALLIQLYFYMHPSASLNAVMDWMTPVVKPDNVEIDWK